MISTCRVDDVDDVEEQRAEEGQGGGREEREAEVAYVDARKRRRNCGIGSEGLSTRAEWEKMATQQSEWMQDKSKLI